METVRDSFVARFGEDQAAAVEAAANGHANEANSDNRGSDPFKWAVLIAIGYECVGRFAEHHGITVPEDDLRSWAVAEGHLATHDGDYDYLGAFVGRYDRWMPKASV